MTNFRATNLHCLVMHRQMTLLLYEVGCWLARQHQPESAIGSGSCMLPQCMAADRSIPSVAIVNSCSCTRQHNLHVSTHLSLP